MLGALAVIVIATVAGTIFGLTAMRWLLSGAKIVGVTVTEVFAKTTVWDCGDPANPGGAASVKARLKANKLTISGAGKMMNGESISDYPWIYNGKIAAIVIGDSVTSIGDMAFVGIDSLRTVVVGNGVTHIGTSAFSRCNSLTSITLGNSVAVIGDMAFEYSVKLRTVNIPDNVRSIGDDAFDDCKNLATIDVAPGNANYSSEDGILFNKDKTVLIRYPEGKQGESYVIPESVTSVGRGAFSCCRKLISVAIPDGVKSIGYMAFFGCESLTSIAIPSGVDSIAAGLFSLCSALASVSIPASVTIIGGGAFDECAALKSVVIPAKVKTIGPKAFWECKKLASVTCLGDIPPVNEFNSRDSTYSPVGDAKRSVCLYVPQRGLDAYKAANGWGNDRFPFKCIKVAASGP
jgi:hypothetical protein